MEPTEPSTSPPAPDRSGDVGKIRAWQVCYKGTIDDDAEWEYDDSGGYVQRGAEPHDEPGLYATEEAAQAECDRLNASPAGWEDPDTYEENPFFALSDDGRENVQEYAAHITLPWPMFWDKLMDLGVEPPIYDGDEDNPTITEEPPDRDELHEWWAEDVCRMDDGRYAEVRDALLPFIVGPQLYFVHEITDKTQEELKALFAVQLAVARKIFPDLDAAVAPAAAVLVGHVERLVAAVGEGGASRVPADLTEALRTVKTILKLD